MTRLTSGDIDTISDKLTRFDKKLKLQTGHDMLAIACHSADISVKNFQKKITDMTLAVVTITAGLGKITGFAQTIKDILTHLGFNVFIPTQTDAAGLACAIENKADIIFMADDNRYFAVNVKNCLVVDNSQATGIVFAAALDLMASGVKGKMVLVLGSGPVGMAAALTLAEFGAVVGIHDKDMEKCQKNCAAIKKKSTTKVEPVHDLLSITKKYCLFIEATNSKDVINSAMISQQTLIAAPGVPLGLTQNAIKKAGQRILYDPLQLGTAAMAVRAVLPLKRG